jgi:hypothetical protein
MANGTTETLEMLERWKAEHPELSGGPSTAPTRRLVPVPSPDPRVAQDEQREMIERWRNEHPGLTGLPRPQVAQPQPQRAIAEQERRDDDRRGFDLDSTPMTVLGAFIVGCIVGGIIMVIITGIAFWGFAGG